MNDDAPIVKKGTTIFVGKPFVYVLNSKDRTARCDNCLKRYRVVKI